MTTILYDVFQKEASGSVLWRAAAATLEEATAHVQKFAASAPGEYVILEMRSGNKLVINADGAGVGQSA
ncbi:MAG: hypothetical protein WAK78_01375 [Candidatus Acidiferrales bacterium]|jgi:hypothetical protein